jgi:hypothetical protein
VSSNTYNWQGACGRWYEFEVARAQREWEQVGGIYMFVKPQDAQESQFGGPICLFIGKTEDFSATLARHDMWQAAENLGAREIHLITIKHEETRGRVMKDLLEAQCPILNKSMLRRVA